MTFPTTGVPRTCIEYNYLTNRNKTKDDKLFSIFFLVFIVFNGVKMLLMCVNKTTVSVCNTIWIPLFRPWSLCVRKKETKNAFHFPATSVALYGRRYFFIV